MSKFGLCARCRNPIIRQPFRTSGLFFCTLVCAEKYQASSVPTQAKRSKFNAKPVVTEEGRFDSQGEYGRWCELKMLQKAKKIQHLARQVRWPLDVDGQTLGHYVCDFKYYDVDLVRWVVEDFKGVATPLYNWKKAHMEAQYGITILETKSR